MLDIYIIVYLDNILIYSRDEKEHVKNVLAVLVALEGAGLRLKLEKYKFYIKKIVFLGYIVSEEGISIDSKKIKSVTE